MGDCTKKHGTVISYWLLLVVFIAVDCASAARLDFSNCVAASVRQQGTYFEANEVDVYYDMDTGVINMTVWGEMFGSLPELSSETNRLTTLRTQAQVLQYQTEMQYNSFCEFTLDHICPFGPSNFTGFYSQIDIQDTYYFLSLDTQLAIIDPTSQANIVACINTEITPKFPSYIYSLLIWVPAGILILVAITVVLAATLNPWNGTKDFFAWSSNYGQDPDTTRLLTPGFGDLLQYLQYAFLLGTLTLDYPGFYQPALSSIGWSVLQFNSSFVSDKSHDSGIDNLYAVSGRYGISTMSQLAGQGSESDIWVSFIVYFLIVTVVVVAICQLAFFLKWIWYKVTERHPVDLRSKNIPVTGGMLVRLFFNYFSLPLITYSTFQLLISASSKVYSSVLAGVLIVLWIVSGILIIRTIRTTRPQQALYDDLPTLLLLGPLYNTFTERGFMFCSIQLFLILWRGIVFGAVQDSGIAQIVLIAVAEVIYFLSINIFRPFNRLTSMNSYYMVLTAVRFLVSIFSLAFIPSLGINSVAKGWIAYVILLLHSLVLLLVFAVHALQVVIELLATFVGVRGESPSTFARAFGVRQLARRRVPKEKFDNPVLSHQSGFASTAMVVPSHNLANSSPKELNVIATANTFNMLDSGQGSSRIDGSSAGGTGQQQSPISPGAISGYDYYRMPRRGRLSNKKSWTAVSDSDPTAVRELASSSSSISSRIQQVPDNFGSRQEPLPASSSKIPLNQISDADAYNYDNDLWTSASLETPSKNIDYAVRESDVYFHTRSAAMSTPSGHSAMPSMSSNMNVQPSKLTPPKTREPLSDGSRYSRKLGTGPADPTGVSAGVKGWFTRQLDIASDRLHLGRSNRGFVVVRNAPLGRLEDEDKDQPVTSSEGPNTGELQINEDANSSAGPRLKHSNQSLNIVVDKTVEKNTFTPIIKSPVPPAKRKQQQQSQIEPSSSRHQLHVLDFAQSDSCSETSGALHLSNSSMAPLFPSQLLDVENGFGGNQLDTSVGAVRSMRVGDAIRTSRYGSQELKSTAELVDE
ncbi:hypothetical protein V1511DRAFT_461080 [Dipodascopsis uninucleata]